MNITVYYPKDKTELKKRAAFVHADAVYLYLEKISCSSEQKQFLLDEIKKNVKNSAWIYGGTPRYLSN